MDPRIELDQSSMGTLLDAIRFAANKHRDQRRKDPAASPYINHPLDVAHILYFEGGVRDVNVLAAAVLHDTVEDTDATIGDVETHFGAHIASIVDDVTDDRTLTRKQRKQNQVDHAPHISNEGKLVKLADKISNLRDVHNCPPTNWKRERQIEYFEWAQRVIQGVRGTNAALEAAFDQVCDHFFERARQLGDHP